MVFPLKAHDMFTEVDTETYKHIKIPKISQQILQ